MSKKIRVIASCLVLVSALLGGSASAAEKRVLRVADVNAEGHVIVQALRHYADRVAELSGGTMQVDVYPAGQLGEDTHCYELLQMGGLDLYRGNASTLGDYGKIQLSAMALPYIFRDREHFWKVVISDLGGKVLDDIQSSGIGMVGIAYLDEGMRNFFTTKASITSLADIKGLKIRVQNAELMVTTVAALGANPTPVSYTELYSALQTGVVDGAENPPASYFSNLFHEPAPNYVLDGHTYSPSIILASERIWQGLTEEQKKILVQAGREVQEYNRKAIEEADNKAYDDMRKAGVRITELTDKDAWIKAMDPVYKRFGADHLDLIKAIQDIR
jgi:tripartite ATP-independent transporter DctP family solute receptor